MIQIMNKNIDKIVDSEKQNINTIQYKNKCECIDLKEEKKKLLKNLNDEFPRIQSYGEVVPSKCELNCDAPIIPFQYQKIFNINHISNQNNIGNADNMNFNFIINSYEENSSYLKICTPPHILLYKIIYK